MPESHEPPSRPYGPWLIHTSDEVYRDPWVRVVKDQVTRPDQQPGTYTVVHIKPGVSVLALDDQGHVHLTEEFHYAVGKTTLETVSGGIDGDESPLVAARRELQEELGLTAQRWDDLGRVDPFTASLLSPTQLFLARELSWGEAAPEGTEQIRRVELPFERAVECVLNGTITHAPSCVLILKVQRLLASN